MTALGSYSRAGMIGILSTIVKLWVIATGCPFCCSQHSWELYSDEIVQTFMFILLSMYFPMCVCTNLHMCVYIYVYVCSVHASMHFPMNALCMPVNVHVCAQIHVHGGQRLRLSVLIYESHFIFLSQGLSMSLESPNHRSHRYAKPWTVFTEC